MTNCQEIDKYKNWTRDRNFSLNGVDDPEIEIVLKDTTHRVKLVNEYLINHCHGTGEVPADASDESQHSAASSSTRTPSVPEK